MVYFVHPKSANGCWWNSDAGDPPGNGHQEGRPRSFHSEQLGHRTLHPFFPCSGNSPLRGRQARGFHSATTSSSEDHGRERGAGKGCERAPAYLARRTTTSFPEGCDPPANNKLLTCCCGKHRPVLPRAARRCHGSSDVVDAIPEASSRLFERLFPESHAHLNAHLSRHHRPNKAGRIVVHPRHRWRRSGAEFRFPVPPYPGVCDGYIQWDTLGWGVDSVAWSTGRTVSVCTV